MQALADSDFVVEAIREDEAVKKTAFSLLDHVCVFLHITVLIQILCLLLVCVITYPACFPVIRAWIQHRACQATRHAMLSIGLGWVSLAKGGRLHSLLAHVDRW